MNKRKCIVKHGWRLFIPYSYTHETYAKKRWIGRTIPDVFANEFHHYGIDHIKSKLSAKEVIIKRKEMKTTTTLAADAERRFEEGDLIVWKDHKHFPPMRADVGVRIVHEDNDIVVIEKSGGLLTATYDYCAKNILEEMFDHKMYTVHRLDRLTSGLLIFAKSANVANEWKNDFQAHAVKKSYFAIVLGSFPNGVVVANRPLYFNKATHKTEVNEKEGKEAVTAFERIGDIIEGCSLVRCLPKTGRTHQIRAHLKYLGYPISNDPLYSEISQDEWVNKDARDLSMFADFVWETVEQKYSQSGCFICSSRDAFEAWMKNQAVGRFQESIFLHACGLQTKVGSFSSEPEWAKVWLSCPDSVTKSE